MGPRRKGQRLGASGIDAVGKQDDEELAVRIDPDRCAGKAGVAKAVRGKVMAAGGAVRRDAPAESARPIRERLWRGELGDGGSFQNTAVSVDAAVQQHLAERCEVRRCTEYARMARDAAYCERVFVVDFALYQPIAQVAVEFSWGDPWPEVFCRPERRVFHAERRKNVRSRKIVQRTSGQTFNDLGHQDDAEIGVNLFCAGFVVERLSEDAC